MRLFKTFTKSKSNKKSGYLLKLGIGYDRIFYLFLIYILLLHILACIWYEIFNIKVLGY